MVLKGKITFFFFCCLFKESFTNRENQIRRLFQSIQKDIKKRVDTMKSQLDDLQTALFDTCENLRVKISSDLSMQEKLAEKVYSEKLLKEAQKLLNKNETNLEKLRKNMYVCENHLKRVNKLYTNFNKTMDNLEFKVNENWLPKVDDIGKIEGLIDGKNIIDELEQMLSEDEDNKIRLKFNQKSDINEINLNFKPYAACELKNGYIAVTNFDKHKLVIFTNETYESIKEITGADNITFRYPSGICTNDSRDYVYLCDQYNHRVIVFDATIDNLLNIIKENFTNPLDACYNRNYLYILDSGNKQIKCFTQDGELCTQYTLNDRNQRLLNSPRHQAVRDDEIAVTDNFDRIYFYVKSSELQNNFQIINADIDSRFMSIYYLDDFMFVHEVKTSNDVITNYFLCYEKDDSASSTASSSMGVSSVFTDHTITNALQWKQTNKREIDTLKNVLTRSYNMSKIGDKLALCMYERKQIILI